MAEGGPTVKIGLLIEGYEATLQDLLTQIVTYWKVGCPTRPLRQNLVQSSFFSLLSCHDSVLSTTHTMSRPCWLSILMKQSNTPFSLYACVLSQLALLRFWNCIDPHDNCAIPSTTLISIANALLNPGAEPGGGAEGAVGGGAPRIAAAAAARQLGAPAGNGGRAAAARPH